MPEIETVNEKRTGSVILLRQTHSGYPGITRTVYWSPSQVIAPSFPDLYRAERHRLNLLRKARDY